jgi:hypothetical protein
VAWSNPEMKPATAQMSGWCRAPTAFINGQFCSAA